jgi:hypothetical protein
MGSCAAETFYALQKSRVSGVYRHWGRCCNRAQLDRRKFYGVILSVAIQHGTVDVVLDLSANGKAEGKDEHISEAQLLDLTKGTPDDFTDEHRAHIATCDRCAQLLAALFKLQRD